LFGRSKRANKATNTYDTNHWVATAFVEDEVYVADSLGNNVSPSVSHWITGS